jgi:hypothetical protein
MEKDAAAPTESKRASIFLYLLSAAIHHSFVVPALETSSAPPNAVPNAEHKNALCE